MAITNDDKFLFYLLRREDDTVCEYNGGILIQTSCYRRTCPHVRIGAGYLFSPMSEYSQVHALWIRKNVAIVGARHFTQRPSFAHPQSICAELCFLRTQLHHPLHRASFWGCLSEILPLS